MGCQNDLGLSCLSRPFWQATSVQNFRTNTLVLVVQLVIFSNLFNDKRVFFLIQMGKSFR